MPKALTHLQLRQKLTYLQSIQGTPRRKHDPVPSTELRLCILCGEIVWYLPSSYTCYSLKFGGGPGEFRGYQSPVLKAILRIDDYLA